MKTKGEVRTGALDQAWAMFLAGGDQAKNATIMAATGLDYSQMWNDRTRRQLEADMLPGHSFYRLTDKNGMELSETAIAAQVVKSRQAGESWGLIMIKAKCNSDGWVRKLFANATGIDSKGLRTGMGGRFVADEPAFYRGADRAKAGTELDPTTSILAQKPEAEAEPARVLPAIKVRGGKVLVSKA